MGVTLLAPLDRGDFFAASDEHEPLTSAATMLTSTRHHYKEVATIVVFAEREKARTHGHHHGQ